MKDPMPPPPPRQPKTASESGGGGAANPIAPVASVEGLGPEELIRAFSEFVEKNHSGKHKRKREREDEDEDSDGADEADDSGRSLPGRFLSRVARRFLGDSEEGGSGGQQRRRRRNIPFPNYLGDHINDILGDLISPRVFLAAMEPAHHSMYEYTVYVPHPGVLNSTIVGRLLSLPSVIWIQIQESKPGEMSMTFTICPDAGQGFKHREKLLSKLTMDKNARLELQAKQMKEQTGTGKFAVLYNVLRGLFDLQDTEATADRMHGSAERMSESTLRAIWPLKRNQPVSGDQIKRISEEPWVTDTCITSFATTGEGQGLALRLFMESD